MLNATQLHTLTQQAHPAPTRQIAGKPTCKTSLISPAFRSTGLKALSGKPWSPAAGLILPYVNTEAMGLHLGEIAKAIAPGAQALLIVDGAGWHGAKALNVPDNITLLKLPPYAPELNPMENVWAYLRSNKLAISVFGSYDEILGKCKDAWNFFANDSNRISSITHRDWITVN